MIHIRLWSSLMMQNIRTKQAEENWSLLQYSFLAGSRKIVPLACRSKGWIYEGVSKSPRTMLITRKSLIVHEFPARVYCGGLVSE